MKTQSAFVFTTCILLAACSGATDDPPNTPRADTIFAAVESDGMLAELDGASGELIRLIDLSEEVHGETMMFDVHNVQGDQDGSTVWLTAMPMSEGDGHAMGPMPEELIGVDTLTSRVSKRIALGTDLHVAHVVTSGSWAYVTAYDADAVLVVDLASKRPARTIALPEGTGPHGARLTGDASQLLVAGMGAGSMHLIDTASDQVRSYDLPGRAVQAAVLPDGSAAFVSVYDTRQVARLDLTNMQVTLFDLPEGSAGPVQLYPGPGGQLWIADQGALDGDPPGNKLYRMDAGDGAVNLAVDVSPAPHGVVVNADGSRVWTTTLLEGMVQAIDSRSGEVVSTAHVGNGPNGITCVHAGGAMP